MDVTALNNIALSQISPSTSPSDISVAILGKQLDVEAWRHDDTGNGTFSEPAYWRQH